MKRIYLFISIFVLLSGIIFYSCNMLFPDDELSQRVDYTGNNLRMDGYYYNYYEPNSTTVHFLYRNGIILRVSSFSTQNLAEIERSIDDYYKYFYNNKDHWGVFRIDGDKIQYEQYTSSVGGGLRAGRRSGYIENTTTFRITENYYFSTKETHQVNDVWHFKQFANKPDSTNVFIK